MLTAVILLASASLARAQTYKASFTEYGAGDTFGSGNCNTDTVACGWFPNPGYSAAVSQNVYGSGPGSGASPEMCGTCWQLKPETDSSGTPLKGAHTIVVKVNNLCPAVGNPLCAQTGLTGTNQYGANVNFDTCVDSGASGALFGSSGVGLALGTATMVDCAMWSGSAPATPKAETPKAAAPAPAPVVQKQNFDITGPAPPVSSKPAPAPVAPKPAPVAPKPAPVAPKPAPAVESLPAKQNNAGPPQDVEIDSFGCPSDP